MDPKIIGLLVVGSMATLAVAAVTLTSYKNKNKRPTRSRILDSRYYPRESESSYYPEDYQPRWSLPRDSLRNSLRDSLRDSSSDSSSNSNRESVYVTPRESLRNSYRRSTFGGKRKSRKKI